MSPMLREASPCGLGGYSNLKSLGVKAICGEMKDLNGKRGG